MYDVLAEVLATLQLRSTIYCQSEFTFDGWELEFAAVSGAVFHIVSRGDCWLSVGEEHRQVCQGDLIVLPRGNLHLLHDLRETRSAASHIPIDLRAEQWQSGYAIYRWKDGQPQTSLVCGMFAFDAYNGDSILTLLPEVLHFDSRQMAANGLKLSIDALIEEANANRQGAATILHRLADILFVQIIRAWLSDPVNNAKGWLAGLRDPQIAAALGAIHANPSQSWTVAALATNAAMSRSAFAARFAEVVGTTPVSYLSAWRMQLATRYLGNPALSLAQVAERVGYTSDLAFRKAFIRAYGVSPARYRRACLSR